MNETLYTYFRIEFTDCGMDYDVTIVENIDEIIDQIRPAELALDDPESPTAKITITGIAMTRKQYAEWFKENMNPD